jgi:ABC-2 type transport system permease protein
VGYRTLVLNLVLKDLRLKYRDSLFGIGWSLLNPLLTLAVYTFAFHTVLQVRMEHYPLFLLVSLLPWTFFSTATLGSTGAVIRNAHLLRKMMFPREVLPLAAVLFAFSQLLLAFLVFLPVVALAGRLQMVWTLPLVVPLLALHLLFASGIALALAPLTVHYRDIAHLTEVALLLLFWLTPIVYPVTLVPSPLQGLVKASPLAAFTIAYQDVLFFGRPPEVQVVGSVVLWTALALFVGAATFARLGPGLAERV